MLSLGCRFVRWSALGKGSFCLNTIFNHDAGSLWNTSKLPREGISVWARSQSSLSEGKTERNFEQHAYDVVTKLQSERKKHEAITKYRQLKQEGVANTNRKVWLTIISNCSKLKMKEFGTEVFQDAINCGLDKDTFVLTEGIRFFGTVGMLDKAQEFFEFAQTTKSNDVIMCGVWLRILAESNQTEKAIQFFNSMKVHDIVTFNIMLQMCSKHQLREVGQRVYQQAIKMYPNPDIRTLTESIRFFGSVNMMNEAQEIFNRAHQLAPDDVVVCGVWLQILAESNQTEKAIQYFNANSRKLGNSVTFNIMLKMCSKHHLKEFGQQIYQQAITMYPNPDIRMLSVSMQFFGSVGMMDKAQEIFNRAHQLAPGDVVVRGSWLQILAESDQTEKAIQFFNSTKLYKHRTFSIMLKMCSKHKLKELGEEIYRQAVQRGYPVNKPIFE